MLQYAIDIAGPGDVILVDAGGDLSNALIGEMMVAYAVKRGVAGIVINGAIRDAGVSARAHSHCSLQAFHTEALLKKSEEGEISRWGTASTFSPFC